MAIQIRKAERSQVKLKVGLSGPSGSGKTMSALLMARGMASSWKKIGIVDTENGSADLYCDLGDYNVITMDTYEPKDYIEAIKAFENAGMEVIIIDSITHEWSAAKDMVDKLGGRFQDWAKVTPIHDRFIQSILQSKCHVITTVRSKTDYSMSTEGGKTKVQKVGLKSETREGFEYELTLSFDININHLAETSKDRTGMFMDADPFVIFEETGKKLLDWANSGVNFDQIIKNLAPKKGKTVAAILEAYKVTSMDDLTISQKRAIVSRLTTLPDFDPNKLEKEIKALEAEIELEEAELKNAEENPTDNEQFWSALAKQREALYKKKAKLAEMKKQVGGSSENGPKKDSSDKNSPPPQVQSGPKSSDKATKPTIAPKSAESEVKEVNHPTDEAIPPTDDSFEAFVDSENAKAETPPWDKSESEQIADDVEAALGAKAEQTIKTDIKDQTP